MAKAATSSSASEALSSIGVTGVPITCTLLITENLLVYGQGPYLRCVDGSNPIKSIRAFASGCTIHGAAIVKEDTDGSIVMVVYGGRDMAVVQLKPELLRTADPWTVQIHYRVDDWIWTCSCMTSDSSTNFISCCCDSHLIERFVLVGLAHNEVLVFGLPNAITSSSQLHLLKRVLGRTRSITYSMALHKELVACGTVTNDILVWSLNDNLEESRLVGHKGAIHRLCFHSPHILASIAEDRSVRLWNFFDGAWSLKWTSWGHTARGWNVAFADEGKCVLSTGEDGTLRVWNYEAGELVTILRGHRTNQSIWSLATSGNQIATGANDGSVATYDLRSVRLSSSIDVSYGPTDKTFEIPDDLCSADSCVIFGMEFVDKRNSNFGGCPTLVVAARDGSMKSFQVHEEMWTHLYPWSESGGQGCSLAVHPVEPRVAIGMKTGEIVVRNALCGSTAGLRLDGKQCRSVQKLVWVDERLLVSFHGRPGTIIMWRLKAGQALELNESRPLVSETNGLGLCCVVKDTHVIVGDSRGSISHFDGASCFVLRRVHGREHVTSIVWEEDGTLLSAGNDGRIVHCEITKSGNLVQLLSVSVSSFTGLTDVWSRTTGHFAGGYHGNRYSIVDVTSGYEHFGVDTGGRQRTLAALVSHEENTAHSIFYGAICAADSQNSLTVRVCSSQERAVEGSIAKSVALPFHCETMFDVAAFALTEAGMYCVVSGSEDCFSILSIFRGVDCVQRIRLPPQVSGVRAVCSLPLRCGLTLAMVASKIEVHFFLIAFEDGRVRVHNQGLAVSKYKVGIDQRANTLAASIASKQRVAVVLGGSDGVCYATMIVPVWGVYSRGIIEPVFRCERPILALSSSTVADLLLVGIGTSGGEALVCNLRIPEPNEMNQCPSWNKAEMIYSFPAHSMGLKKIVIDSKLESTAILVRIFSCGDDQALNFVELEVQDDSALSRVRIRNSIRVNNASFSALRGLCVLSNSCLVTAGYAGKLGLWSFSESSLELIQELPVSVGDVNCLATAVHHGSDGADSVVVVGGSGFELFNFSSEQLPKRVVVCDIN